MIRVWPNPDFASRSFLGLVKGCALTMFALLLFASTYTQVWYLSWCFLIAVLIPETWIVPIASISLFAAVIQQPIDGFIFRWGPDRIVTPSFANIFVYSILFAIPVLSLLFFSIKQIFWQSRSATQRKVQNVQPAL